MDYFWTYTSPLGAMTMGSDGTALTGLWFDGQRHFGSTLKEGAERRALPVFDETVRWLEAYFAGEVPAAPPPLHLCGTAFQQAVWALLCTIPYGETTTYGALAQRVAAALGVTSVSAQAVGGAVGRNPVSLIVPCHRVLSIGGGLTGYAAGLKRKAALLTLEGAAGYTTCPEGK